MGDELRLVLEQMGIPGGFVWVFVLILIWSAIWKLLALWKSARKGSPFWFVLLFLVNTVGILEILYIFLFSKIKCCQRKAPRHKTAKKRRR
ncbi:DUF5652 family protein [Candidatus Pacearchaeota archaeon]|nr:DUF5652 family protein [Candidatus Pacearchaeota archaeon]